MDDRKFRLITRADFDGVVCGALFKEMDMLGDVRFVEPWQMQKGEIPVTGEDISTNLPYVEGIHLCFDHHVSEFGRVSARDNWIIEADAPSAARVVYNHYGGKERFPEIDEKLMAEVDRADSAQYGIDDILAPDDWTLLNFILDPRTGLSVYRDFSLPDAQLMVDMMTYLRHHPVKEIMLIPDVEERLHVYAYHAEFHERQLNRRGRVEGRTVVVDLRGEKLVHPGNRFMIYGLNPECTVSVVLKAMAEHPDQIEIAVGKSIIDRSSPANIGAILLEYGGGGHRAAGTCRVPDADADRVVAEILARLAAA